MIPIRPIKIECDGNFRRLKKVSNYKEFLEEIKKIKDLDPAIYDFCYEDEGQKTRYLKSSKDFDALMQNDVNQSAKIKRTKKIRAYSDLSSDNIDIYSYIDLENNCECIDIQQKPVIIETSSRFEETKEVKKSHEKANENYSNFLKDAISYNVTEIESKNQESYFSKNKPIYTQEQFDAKIKDVKNEIIEQLQNQFQNQFSKIEKKRGDEEYDLISEDGIDSLRSMENLLIKHQNNYCKVCKTNSEFKVILRCNNCSYEENSSRSNSSFCRENHKSSSKNNSNLTYSKSNQIDRSEFEILDDPNELKIEKIIKTKDSDFVQELPSNPLPKNILNKLSSELIKPLNVTHYINKGVKSLVINFEIRNNDYDGKTIWPRNATLKCIAPYEDCLIECNSTTEEIKPSSNGTVRINFEYKFYLNILYLNLLNQ